MDRMDLLKKIMATDFMVIDFQLYLNTHPDDQEVLSLYNSFVVQSKALKADYEEKYGMLCQGSSQSSYPWQWINQPWPWEYDANFELDKEER